MTGAIEGNDTQGRVLCQGISGVGRTHIDGPGHSILLEIFTQVSELWLLKNSVLLTWRTTAGNSAVKRYPVNSRLGTPVKGRAAWPIGEVNGGPVRDAVNRAGGGGNPGHGQGTISVNGFRVVSFRERTVFAVNKIYFQGGVNMETCIKPGRKYRWPIIPATPSLCQR